MFHFKEFGFQPALPAAIHTNAVARQDATKCSKFCNNTHKPLSKRNFDTVPTFSFKTMQLSNKQKPNV